MAVQAPAVETIALIRKPAVSLVRGLDFQLDRFVTDQGDAAPVQLAAHILPVLTRSEVNALIMELVRLNGGRL